MIQISFDFNFSYFLTTNGKHLNSKTGKKKIGLGVEAVALPKKKKKKKKEKEKKTK